MGVGTTKVLFQASTRPLMLTNLAVPWRTLDTPIGDDLVVGQDELNSSHQLLLFSRGFGGASSCSRESSDSLRSFA